MDVGHRVWDGGGQDGDPQHDPQQIPKAQDVQGGSGEQTFTAVGGCIAQMKHSYFPPSSPGFKSHLHRYIFSLLLSL